MDNFRDLTKTDRVRAHTAPLVNDKIEQLTDLAVARAAEGGRDAIVHRMGELDREWDLDRAVMASFAVLGSASFVWSRRSRVGTWLLHTQLAFLLVHTVFGWCPPAAVLRRFGVRTMREIEAERRTLDGLLATA